MDSSSLELSIMKYFLPIPPIIESASASAPVPAPATAEEENTRYQEVINNVQLALEKLEQSSYFTEFTKHVQEPEIAAQIERVIATDPQYSQLQLVLYGVGEMERSGYTINVEICHMQLAFAILLKQKFQWVNDIVVYDPSVIPLQQKAISSFDCTFLSVNEYGRRTVDRPTLFYLPHCPTVLVNNVLSANWTKANLNKIIILGDSFKAIKKDIDRLLYLRSLKHLMAILHSDKILSEMPLPDPGICKQTTLSTGGVYKHAYIGKFSWHFFPLDGSIEDLSLNLYPESTVSSSRLDSVIWSSSRLEL